MSCHNFIFNERGHIYIFVALVEIPICPAESHVPIPEDRLTGLVRWMALPCTTTAPSKCNYEA